MRTRRRRARPPPGHDRRRLGRSVRLGRAGDRCGHRRLDRSGAERDGGTHRADLSLALVDAQALDEVIRAYQVERWQLVAEAKVGGGGHVAGTDQAEPSPVEAGATDRVGRLGDDVITGPDVVSHDEVSAPPRHVHDQDRRAIHGQDEHAVRTSAPDAHVVGHVRLLRVVVGEIDDICGHVDRTAAARPHHQPVQAELGGGPAGMPLAYGELLARNESLGVEPIHDGAHARSPASDSIGR